MYPYSSCTQPHGGRRCVFGNERDGVVLGKLRIIPSDTRHGRSSAVHTLPFVCLFVCSQSLLRSQMPVGALSRKGHAQNESRTESCQSDHAIGFWCHVLATISHIQQANPSSPSSNARPRPFHFVVHVRPPGSNVVCMCLQANSVVVH